MVLAKTVRNRFVLLLRVYPDTFALALASPRFRLAGQCLPFSLKWWVSVMRVVFGRGGMPNGMVGFVGLSHCGSPTGGSGRFLQNGYNIVTTDSQPR